MTFYLKFFAKLNFPQLYFCPFLNTLHILQLPFPPFLNKEIAKKVFQHDWKLWTCFYLKIKKIIFFFTMKNLKGQLKDLWSNLAVCYWTMHSSCIHRTSHGKIVSLYLTNFSAFFSFIVAFFSLFAGIPKTVMFMPRVFRMCVWNGSQVRISCTFFQ